ncbi:DUF2199 domain-containing protein [Bradyrhizobium sp. WYCCWR 12699]|uniref:DUF2199 domain-containing protein n=1 Tax=Bradyrhizobium sp. WYCCWR 12699 TaxID=3064203 RepID=UPI003917D265
MPGYSADAPLYFYSIPTEERDRRCALDADTCIVDDEHYFARGCLEIPVHGESEPFIWGVWVSLSQTSFATFKSARISARFSAGCPPSCHSIRAPRT